jgi:NTP pyrophosphatase (non-canonical NTP hydrolase)
MKRETLDFIRKLSLLDKKTLSQKGLKVSEESGELAKAILPFDNADGTTHRFIAKEKILEEVSDTILTAISIAYQLGYSHEDIEEMMYQKAVKWQGLQAREEKVKYPLPYEVHVTVKHPDNLEQYKKDCEECKVKPIVLDLESRDIITKDVMTSSKFFGDNRGAYEEMKRISGFLRSKGYVVVREKVETIPWHPAAPFNPAKDVMPKDCYFECHLGAIITQAQKKLLQEIAQAHEAHLSRNFFKKLDGGKFVNMITYRLYGGKGVCYDFFKEKVGALKASLTARSIPFEKEIIEFSIYDTKVSHDDAWIRKS